MSNIPVAIVEDTASGRDLGLEAIAESEGLIVQATLSEAITRTDPQEQEQKVVERLAKIQSYSGPLIMLLDLDLKCSESKREEWRERYRSCFRTTDQIVLTHEIDGLTVALEAIQNERISPLVIGVATQSPTQRVIDQLNHLIEEVRQGRDAIVVRVTAVTVTEKATIIHDLGQLKQHFERLRKTALDLLRQSFLNIRALDEDPNQRHEKITSGGSKKAKQVMIDVYKPLYGGKTEEIMHGVASKLTHDEWLNLVKSMTNADRDFYVGSAVLVSLGAYLQKTDDWTDWNTVFPAVAIVSALMCRNPVSFMFRKADSNERWERLVLRWFNACCHVFEDEKVGKSALRRVKHLGEDTTYYFNYSFLESTRIDGTGTGIIPGLFMLYEGEGPIEDVGTTTKTLYQFLRLLDVFGSDEPLIPSRVKFRAKHRRACHVILEESESGAGCLTIKR